VDQAIAMTAFDLGEAMVNEAESRGVILSFAF
jgi:hypothetical protein